MTAAPAVDFPSEAPESVKADTESIDSASIEKPAMAATELACKNRIELPLLKHCTKNLNVSRLSGWSRTQLDTLRHSEMSDFCNVIISAGGRPAEGRLPPEQRPASRSARSSKRSSVRYARRSSRLSR